MSEKNSMYTLSPSGSTTRTETRYQRPGTQRTDPAIVSGFDTPEGNLHSPNERFLVEHFPLGVAAARELFTSLAELG